MLSIVITRDPYLSSKHLEFQILALNQQIVDDFEVVYLNQSKEIESLRQYLKSATYPYQIYDLPYPHLGNVCCWDLVRVMAIVCENLRGRYLTYLHQECLPDPGFVADTLQGIQTCEEETGNKDNIYLLNQLRSPLTVVDLEQETWLTQVDTPDAISWIGRRPIARDYLYRPQAWEEDAFVLPLALVEQLKLFAAVEIPLFFQDLFDIFLQLEDRPYTQGLGWYRLGRPVIYHLNHPREFREYRQAFLLQVRQHPEIFGHLALYELAASDFDYTEPFVAQERQIQTHLHQFVHFMRYSEKGTVTLWRRALDWVHG